MASENQWAIDLESTVVALVKAKALPQLKSKYPNIKITDEESSSTSAVFPTVYIHMLGGNERGKTLDGQSINALSATFQVDVTANTSKADCRRVMGAVMEIFKQMRFEGSQTPEMSINNKIHRSVARLSRIIAANDRLL